MKNFGSLFYKPKKNERAIKAKRWNVWSILGGALKKTCMVIGAMVLISTLISVFLIVTMSKKSAAPLPEDIILYFDMKNGISEAQVKPTILEPFPFTQPTLRNVIDTIERAKDDARVKGLVFNLNGAAINMAHTQELRAAINKFKEGGKFTKVYSSSYTDAMGGLGQYYLASVFDEIWMQPIGMMSVSGISMEMPFAKDLMDKVGVSAQFFQREEFKSAMENFTNSEMSPANEVALTSLLNNLSVTMLNDISKEREISQPQLMALVDKGIMTDKEGLNAKLLDRLDYGDKMLSEIRESISGDPDDESVELVTLARYSQSKQNKVPRAKTADDVALIYVIGAIVDHKGAGGNAGAYEITQAIATAYNDDDIKAIVLRVDSPGGSPTASETIRHALVRAQEKGKKVIVSMGPVAASGGYWISTHADKILANSGTITGSIGVIMGKFEGSDLFDKANINWQGPKFGENADIFSIHKKFDENAQARMTVLIDDVYDAFVSRVSEGRKMSKEDARTVAKGRAWTGSQALKRGLVDQIGGLNDALDETAILLGKKDRRDLNVIQMPRELNGLERVLELFGQEVGLGHFMKIMFGAESRMAKMFNSYTTQQHVLSTGNHTSVYDAELDMLR